MLLKNKNLNKCNKKHQITLSINMIKMINNRIFQFLNQIISYKIKMIKSKYQLHQTYTKYQIHQTYTKYQLHRKYN